MALMPYGLMPIPSNSFAPDYGLQGYPQPQTPPGFQIASNAPVFAGLLRGHIVGGSSSHPPGALQPRKVKSQAMPEDQGQDQPAMQPSMAIAPAINNPQAAQPGPDAENTPGIMDSVSNGLRNIYGNGGAGDTLISLGAGLLSHRGVGNGLGQGFNNVAAMTELQNQRQRQATLDKLAQGREERQIAWNNYLQKRQGEQDALEAKKFDADQAYRQQSLALTGARVNQPEIVEKRTGPDTAQKFWIRPGETEGKPFGEPYHVTDPSAGFLSDDATKSMADRILAGEKGVLTGLGRGAQGPENIRRVQEEVARRNPEAGAILGKQIEAMGQGAESRTLGTQEANAIAAGTEALGALKIGRDTSAALPRGSYVPVNMAIQAWQKGTSNPQLAAYGRAMHTIANTYARAVNPKGLPHEKVVDDTVKSLSSAQGPEALNSMLNVMEQEINMAQRSPAQARETLKALREGREPAPSNSGGSISGNGWRLR